MFSGNDGYRGAPIVFASEICTETFCAAAAWLNGDLHAPSLNNKEQAIWLWLKELPDLGLGDGSRAGTAGPL